MINNAKNGKSILRGEYFERYGLYMIFIFCAFMSIVLWVCNWICYYRDCCCFNIFDDYCNKVFVWWLSFIFLLGVLACCIAGFVTANRLGFASYGIQCASERIYYDMLNGQLKSTYPKWEGISKTQSYINGLNNIYNYIEDPDNTDKFYWKNESHCSDYLIYPVLKEFADDACKFEPDSINNVNQKLYIGITSLYNLYKYKEFSLSIDTSDLSSLINQMNSAMSSYKKNFIEEVEYYVKVARGVGQILPLIYFAILLVVVVFSGILLIIYFCNCFSSVHQQNYIFLMHIAWNFLRFFIFSFFMYGFGFGAIFLFARDAIGYIQYIFSEENIGESSTKSIILNDDAKKTFNYCLYSGNNNYANISIPNDFIDNTLKMQTFINNLPTLNDDNTGYFIDYRDALKDAYSVIDPNNNLLNYQKVYNNTGSIYSGLNCSFIQNNLNLMYRALWDFAWEARILCTLSCFIGFMGAIAVYGFLWSMYLWKNNNNDGYRYIGRNGYNYPNETNNPMNSPLKSKKRNLKKPFIPPPKPNNDEYYDNNMNTEMQDQNNNGYN